MAAAAIAAPGAAVAVDSAEPQLKSVEDEPDSFQLSGDVYLVEVDRATHAIQSALAAATPNESSASRDAELADLYMNRAELYVMQGGQYELGLADTKSARSYDPSNSRVELLADAAINSLAIDRRRRAMLERNLMPARAYAQALAYAGSSMSVSTVCGGGSGHAALSQPNGLCVHPSSGAIVIADTGHDRIVIVRTTDTGGTAGTATRLYAVTDINRNVTFSGPEAVCIDSLSADLVYVSDTRHHRIVAFELPAFPSPNTNTAPTCEIAELAVSMRVLAGSGLCGYSDGDGLTVAQFACPTGIAFLPQTHPLATTRRSSAALLPAPSASLLVCDKANHTIRQICIETGAVSTFAGRAGVAGNTNGKSALSGATAGGGGGDAKTTLAPVPGRLSSTFQCPNALAVARDGTVYVADFGNGELRRIDARGSVWTIAVSSAAAGGGQATATFRPAGLALSCARTGGDSKSAPAAAAVDPEQYLFISDMSSHRIARIDTRDTADCELLGGAHTAADLAGDDADAASVSAAAAIGSGGGYADGHQFVCEFRSPIGLCTHPQSGSVLVADAHNSAIREVRLHSADDIKRRIAAAERESAISDAVKKADIDRALAVYHKPAVRMSHLLPELPECDRGVVLSS